ncbi:hypothetical protein N0V83_009327 [Neocucurbitaria cava]|uniref:Uncharacterized protein n=1 Tax=Neocucurbitaria cava TaxID=798079 RepID=A0A9W8Y0P8_9PLEO|nr:hypothetical protein N0V83_009327 [Neocucurbitaria cava]
MLLPHDTLARDTGLLIANNLPAILGNNIAGMITTVGEGVTSFKVDDHVFGMSSLPLHGSDPSDQSGLQEYAILNVNAIGRTPDNFSDEQVVTLPVNLVTAWTALFTESGFKIIPPFSPKVTEVDDHDISSILIIGGGTNAGQFAVQLARIAGIEKIVVIAGLKSKLELMGMGATSVIDRHAPLKEVAQQAQEIVGTDGATHVLDCANTELFTAIATLSATQRSQLRSLRHIKADELDRLKSQRPLCDAAFLGSVSMARLAPHTEVFWTNVPRWLEEGRLRPAKYLVVDGLEKVAEINEVLDGYRGLGRVGHQSVVRIA